MDIKAGHWAEIRWWNEPNARLVEVERVGTGYVVAGGTAYKVEGEGQMPVRADKGGNVIATVLRSWPSRKEAVAALLPPAGGE